MKNLKKHAFTLAEVLITLGIIGVVAALTLPTLIAKYQNQVYVNKLKKMISTLENGLRQAAAEEGVEVDKSSLYRLFNIYAWSDEIKEKRYNVISKYFKVAGKDEIMRGENVNNDMHGAIIFMDGSMLEYENGNGYILIDVNGDSKPREFGKDKYKLIQDKKGILHDYDDCPAPQILERDDEYNTEVISAQNCGQCETTLKNNPNFNGCYLYRIQSNGWKMDY